MKTPMVKHPKARAAHCGAWSRTWAPTDFPQIRMAVARLSPGQGTRPAQAVMGAELGNVIYRVSSWAKTTSTISDVLSQ